MSYASGYRPRSGMFWSGKYNGGNVRSGDGKAMLAKFAGKCVLCGGRINKGDPIIYDGKARHAPGNGGNDCNNNDPIDMDDDSDVRMARADRAHDNAEYAKGIADYNRDKANRDLMGEDYANAEAYAWEMRDPSY